MKRATEPTKTYKRSKTPTTTSTTIATSTTDSVPEHVNETTDNDPSEPVGRHRMKQQFCNIRSSKDSEIIIKKSYSSKCSPKSFLEAVKDLNIRQVEDVRDLGFGGLLMLKIKSLPLGILPWLVQNFNPYNCLQTLGNNVYHITPDDVHDILCIPINPDKRIQATTYHVKGQSKDISLINKWMKILKVSKEEEMTLDKVVTAFREKVNGGDDFKRLFVLYSVSILLSPNADRKVDKSLFRVLEDISQVPQLDWCTFVLDRLCHAVKRYFENDSQSVVNGCVLILLIAYLHRLPFKGIRAPIKLPLIQHWVDADVKKRVKDELQVGYGTGVFDLTTYPITKVYSEWSVSGRKDPVSVVNDLETEIRLGDDGVNVNIDIGDTSSHFIHYAIPAGLPSNSEIKSLSANALDESGAILKRDFEVIMKEHMMRLSTVDLRNRRVSQEEIFSQTQRIMESPGWQAYIDDLVKDMLQKSVKTLSSGEAGVDNVNISPTVDRCDNDVHDCADTRAVEGSNDIATDNSNECDINEGANLCSIDLGSPDIEVEYLSKFMRGNRLAFMGMRQLEKQVCDYCFLSETTSPTEVLARFSDQHLLVREDIHSLETFQKIQCNVIECWALYLNELSRRRKEQPLVFCFGLSHSKSLKAVLDSSATPNTQTVHILHTAWKQWVACNHKSWDLSKVEMFFVPYFCDGHFCVVVINIATGIVEYLDNIKRSDREPCLFLAESVRDEISTFLESVCHPTASDIINYEVNVVHFDWALNENNDCGVYLMYFMESYDGSHDLTPLLESRRRRLYRALVCSQLVTCNLNKVRVDILKNVDDFQAHKEQLKLDVENQRKIMKNDKGAPSRKSKKGCNR